MQTHTATHTAKFPAAAFGLRWVFLVTAAVLLVNLVWVYYRVPEYADR